MPKDETLAGETLDPDEPEWGPLEDLVHGLLGDFMYMFAVDLEDGRRLHAYKHYYTRRYLHLAGDGRAYGYTASGRYEEINPIWAIDVVLREHSELRGPESAAEPWRVRT